MSDDYVPDSNNAHVRAGSRELMEDIADRGFTHREAIVRGYARVRAARKEREQAELRNIRARHRRRPKPKPFAYTPEMAREDFAKRQACRRPMPVTAGWVHDGDVALRCHVELPDEYNDDRFDPHWESFKRYAFENHFDTRSLGRNFPKMWPRNRSMR